MVETKLFESQHDWAAWLEKNHRTSTGIWIRLAKKHSGLRSVSYQEAVEVALCYGWIDGQKRPEINRLGFSGSLPAPAASGRKSIVRKRSP